MEKKKNILVVHNYYQIPGGEDTVVANEVKMLEEHGHEVTLYTRKNSEINELPFIKKLLLPFTSIFSLRTYREVKRIIRDKRIDIVHVHNTLTMISPSVYYAALACKVPVVQTIHNFRLICPGATFYREGHICEDCTTKGLRCAIKHGCYRESRMQTFACVVNMLFHRMVGVYGRLNYICLTEFNKEKILNLKQINPQRVFVKPNFVIGQNAFPCREERLDQFVFVGRLEKLKGIDVLLNVWTKLGKEAPKLIVCGSGPLNDWCKRFVGESGCNVEFRGYVSNEEIRTILSQSKAMILPTQCYEGFPMSIVESFSVGTPVIVPAMGNCGCIVNDNVTGWKYRSIEELMKCVWRGRSTSLFDTVRTHFEAQFTESINYELLDHIYSIVSQGQ
ncbi:MAG: glycosyltransferase family 4 protein [Acetatifactor sp.]